VKSGLSSHQTDEEIYSTPEERSELPLQTFNQFHPLANLNDDSEFLKYVPSVKRSQPLNNRYVKHQPKTHRVRKNKECEIKNSNYWSQSCKE